MKVKYRYLEVHLFQKSSEKQNKWKEKDLLYMRSEIIYIYTQAHMDIHIYLGMNQVTQLQRQKHSTNSHLQASNPEKLEVLFRAPKPETEKLIWSKSNDPRTFNTNTHKQRKKISHFFCVLLYSHLLPLGNQAVPTLHILRKSCSCVFLSEC